MPSMDKKQRKEKKRQEKKKAIRMKASTPVDAGTVADRKSFGQIQLVVFGIVALAGALLIVLNV